MDLVNWLLWCLMCWLFGAVSILLIQYAVYVRWFSDKPIENTDNQRNIIEQFAIPEGLMSNIKSTDPDTKNSVTAFNLIFQFLFYELRYSTRVRSWFYRKITIEMEELIMKTSVSKFFEKFLVRDLDLGSEFPEMKNMRVHNVDLHETEGHIETLDLVMELQYNGHFKLAIDGDMVLGKKVFLSLKVKHVSGLCRLQFTRKPYSHWSICFIGDPKLDMHIETLFQGRPLQPHLTSLISHQIRKAIRRKHTLPIYKIRYKPFFQKTDPHHEYDQPDIEPFGRLEVNTCELTRLRLPAQTNHVFCTLTAAPFPWVMVRQQDQTSVLVTLEVVIHRAKNQQIGIIFKQCEASVCVEGILPNTPATKADIMPGDRLIFIENKPVAHINQISKIIRMLNKKEITMQLERLMGGVIWNDNGCDEAFDEYEDLDDFTNITFTKGTDSVHIGTKRKSSTGTTATMQTAVTTATSTGTMGTAASEMSSRLTTPSSSPKKSDCTISATSRDSKQSAMYTDALTTKSSSSSSSSGPEKLEKEVLLSEEQLLLRQRGEIPDRMQQHTTIDALANSVIRINDLAHFNLNRTSNWMNICVFGRCNENVEFLGYVNVPLAPIIIECGESNLWQMVHKYRLKPPSMPNLASHQMSEMSGFEPRFCFGDILLSFVWTGPEDPMSATEEQNKKYAANSANPYFTNTTFHVTIRVTSSNMNTSLSAHNFVRTHFARSTQCDYCGKKIWLKDAVQCRVCNMSCHKKCIKKCQTSTVCNALTTDVPTATTVSLTEPNAGDADKVTFNIESDEAHSPTTATLEQHRNSFTGKISQNIMKRVNSANNLTIPGMGSAIGHSRSLPPSPQHSPRKQSLVNQSTNPFVVVVQKLEQFSDVLDGIAEEQISSLTEPLIGWGTMDDLMGLAKTASRSLYADLEPNDRVDKINILLARLRIALDVETKHHADISMAPAATSMSEHRIGSTENTTNAAGTIDHPLSPSPTPSNHQAAADAPTASPGSGGGGGGARKLSSGTNAADSARKAFLIGQSEERVQALSVVMLHLCTGLQYAQGVATQ